MERQPSKRHIAMLIGALGRGGSERVLVNLSEYFVEQGYQVTMVTQHKREEEYPLNRQVKRVLSDISQQEEGKSRILNFIKRFRLLRRIWKEEKPDVILSFIGKNNIMALLTSRFLGIPVAVSVRGEPTEEYYNGILKLLARHLFILADGIILQTRRSMEFFPKAVRKKAVILKNPVNASFFREPYNGEREKVITAVGRVDDNKNHELLLRAFAGIAEEFPDYRLVIYGEGECRAGLTDLAEKLGLSERIALPGAVSNVAEAIYKAQIFVLSSNTEGVPNTLIEAMLLGLTVISTDCPCGGPGELIENGVNGLLVQVGNEQQMEESLRHVLRDRELAASLGKNAGSIADSYRPDVVYESWRRYLDSLM